MTGDEIRAAFLGFFSERRHRVIPSSSLIPHGDPTLLLTSAGMVQLKPYFLGEAAPPSPRLASCQKCFRTTDIEAVGDSSHLTFFEMLGNFSFGDYFKKEAIGWAWQFVTRRLGLPPQRLWATVFLDDDAAFGIWRKLGIPQDRILRFGEEDNFWGPAGDSGPCGPSSEIHYDFGPEHGCGKPSCAPNCDCGRFSEIWNLVFIQYNQDRKGQRRRLAKPSIDTGMGLERTAAVMQGKTSVYETDLFMPLIEHISRLLGSNYGADDSADNDMRIIAEHSRGIAFLIADGVLPSNEGRGYVLRRLLRRAALSGRRLALEKPFLAEMARTTIDTMGHVYPELGKRRDFVLKAVELEEARFAETLSSGLELLDSIMAQASSQVRSKITGEQAFKLYDTYGFPVELTREVAQKQGFAVDIEGFERAMGRQRQRARAARKPLPLAEKKVNVAPRPELKATTFVGYHSLRRRAKIVDLLADGESVATVQEGGKASIVLDKTPFYAEMGGQVGDTGEMHGSSGRFTVTNTVQSPPGVVLQQGYVAAGSLSVGDKVTAAVDRERRLDIARNHTATHLLQSALRQVLGSHIQQRGSLVAPDRLRFDFSHLKAMTQEEIDEVQRIVNMRIRQNLPVYDQDIPYRQAIEAGAIALFDEKYGDVVRVLKIGRPAISAELCGGTHVAASGELGFFQIVAEAGIGAGLRRIEAVSGRGAEQATRQRVDTLSSKVSHLLAELDEEKKRTRALEREIGRVTAGGLLLRVKTVNGIRLIAEKVASSPIEMLRQMSDYLREQLKSGIIVLGTVYEDKPLFLAAVTRDLVEKGYHAGEIVKRVARVAGGGGGGRASLAQGGGKDKDRLDEAMRRAKELI